MSIAVLFVGAGASATPLRKELQLARESYNLFASPDLGGLVNYKGREDIFVRDDGPGGSSAPPDDVAITRVFCFRDAYQIEHLVYVQGASLYRREGNGYQRLYTFIGRSEGGRFFPTLFVHDSKLIVLNDGDPVIVWNGLIKAHPLGVLEVPLPPSVNVVAPPGEDHGAHGIFQWRGMWWPGKVPANGLADQENVDGDPIDGIYQAVLQWKDYYGNKGRPSPACAPFLVPHWVDKTTYYHWEWAVARWARPVLDEHITGIVIGRTQNLNPEDVDGGLGGYNLYYEEAQIGNPVEQAFVFQVSDTALLSNGAIDLTVEPPSSCSLGCSWRGRIFFADQDSIFWTDAGFFGQCRQTQRRRSLDQPSAVVPLQDRVVLVTRSSTEVFYEGQTGVIGMLDQHTAHGSVFGRTLVQVGDRIFGLWNQGWGTFDGLKHEYQEVPYWLRDIYIDAEPFNMSASTYGEWYILTVRKDSTNVGDSRKNNVILKHHIPTKQWYVVLDSLYDVTYWQTYGVFVGCDDSIYQLDAGLPRPAALVVDSLLPALEGVEFGANLPLTGIALLMEPAGNDDMDLTLEGRWDADSVTLSCTLLPSRNAGIRSKELATYYNNQLFTDEPTWAAPNQVWIQATPPTVVSGYQHRIEIVFPENLHLHLLGLRLDYGGPRNGL